MNSSPYPPDLFPSSLQEATQIQNRLAEKVEREDRFSPLQWVGGVDVSNNLYDPHKMIYAAMVVLDAKTLQIQEEAQSSCKQLFPYIPGFLGFREAPVLVETFTKIKKKPQVILVDGHGISHPRGLGIASHLGVLLDCPTIGVAKKILVGKPQGELGPLPFDQVPLVWKKKVIGILLRTRKNSHPIIISPGHRVSQESALAIVKSCLRGFKLPEPTRLAHLGANACRIHRMGEKK